ncbi:MAG: HD domain-containing phosphohydrolase [Bacillota bacterium]|uniref:HD domain-containing phosphohydrolase n=1 Tax=Desulfurispora thermophila TaxID=265470 RepID=UPI001FA6E314|nr:HD domain-containing phosphohydrolase [Desulfurispora thermophila]
MGSVTDTDVLKLVNQVMDLLPYGVLCLNEAGILVYINKIMEKYLGEEKTGLIGRPLLENLTEGQLLDHKGRPHHPLLFTLQTGKELKKQPCLVINKKSNLPRSFLVSTHLLYDEDNNLAGVCGFYHLASQQWKIANNGEQSKISPSEHVETVFAFAEAIGARDYNTMGHSEKVAEYARMLAEYMGLDEKMVEMAYLCGIVHDVGKIGIPENILNKPGRLTEEEYNVIKKHVDKGIDILACISWLEEIVPIIKAHHERYDGTGYPDQLQGEEIPLLGRIIAVADAFDAMTSNRSYRKALPLEEAIDELKKNAGRQFDPEVVNAFIKMLGELS